MSKRILFAVAAIALAAAGIFYRAASMKAARVEVKKIVQADTAGADTTAQVAGLKNYVAAHMGASVSFTLNGAYERAKAAAAASAAQPTGNNQVYAEAEKACGGKSDSITQAKCVSAYVAPRLSAAPTPTPAPQPQLANYQYKLTAPLWTPDLAGALLLGAFAAAAIGLLLGKSRKKLK